MESSTNVIRLRQPDEIDDPLTDVLRVGARRLLAQAVEMEGGLPCSHAGSPAAGRACPPRTPRSWAGAGHIAACAVGQRDIRSDPAAKGD